MKNITENNKKFSKRPNILLILLDEFSVLNLPGDRTNCCICFWNWT